MESPALFSTVFEGIPVAEDAFYGIFRSDDWNLAISNTGRQTTPLMKAAAASKVVEPLTLAPYRSIDSLFGACCVGVSRNFRQAI
jgi:hypothetical protein